MKAKTLLTSVAMTCAISVTALGNAAYAQVCNGLAPCDETVTSNLPTVSLTNEGAGAALDARLAVGAIPPPPPKNTALRATNESTSANAFGLLGVVSSSSSGGNSAGVRGINRGAGGGEFPPLRIGVWGSQDGVGIGVLGQSTNGWGVRGEGITGVSGRGDRAGVSGFGTVTGVVGLTSEGTGVRGTSSGKNGAGVFGDGTTGVRGTGRQGGDGVLGQNRNIAGSAGTFLKGNFNRPNTLAALQVRNTMSNGEAAWLQTTDPRNGTAVLKLLLPTRSRGSFLECHSPDGARKCWINSIGTFVGGSDFAEALPARGYKLGYEPGDVLVMASDGSGIEKTSEPYSRRVVGVFSTRPAILGADKGGEIRIDPEDVPVAIMGIVPTKVSGENGAIEVGDLLVTAATPGHAMKGADPTRMFGAVIGKALKPLTGETGVIPVLVTP